MAPGNNSSFCQVRAGAEKPSKARRAPAESDGGGFVWRRGRAMVCVAGERERERERHTEADRGTAERERNPLAKINVD